MPVEIVWRPEVGKKVENFFNNSGYKDYLENAVAFNRKLNEERKMRLPYIDGQTGVAMRHYNSQRFKRERMPGSKPGQVYSYPQKHWKKKRYQYLRYFMQPKHLERDVAEMISISQIENSNSASGMLPGSVSVVGGPNEESNTSTGKDEMAKASDWSYYEDIFQEGDEDLMNSDSDDFEYEDTYTKKKAKGAKKPSKPKTSTKGGATGGGSIGTGAGGSKRRTHADQIPDSEKPFSCEYCGVKYKTRPGLTYHVKNTHKDKDGNLITPAPTPFSATLTGGELLHDDGVMIHGSMGGPSMVPPSMPMGSSTFTELSNSRFGDTGHGSGPGMGSRPPARAGPSGHADYREDRNFGGPQSEDSNSGQMGGSKGSATPRPKTIAPDGKEIAAPLGYCDFCLGDSSENKKTNEPEELVSCAECGRSGHPTCLQFTDNMLVSVRKYAWQCIECKCCTLCGTAENDDQLLFCDDCDRGYHMYCIVPKIKEPPEGSWSCKLCIETFHS